MLFSVRKVFRLRCACVSSCAEFTTKQDILEAIHNINLESLIDSLISLVSAFIFGGLIGFERQYRQRTAGLRTNVLVTVGAAIFVDMANRLDGHSGAVRVVSYVVSGIGFLGAGVIMREQGNVRGLNTAATLWGSAAVGCCCGADLILETALSTVFGLMANTLLRPVVNRINRQPADAIAIEAINTVVVIADGKEQERALHLLKEALAAINYPPSEIKTHAFGSEEVEIEATLAAVSVDAKELDRLVSRLSGEEIIRRVFW
jgi:putative Mg2+ transporter-C (MgtC) family protein